MTTQLITTDNALPEITEEMSDEQLNRLLGFSVVKRAIPKLNINRLPQDAAGNPLQAGTFFVSDEQPAYAKNITVRVLYRGYQYTRYDEVEKRFTDMTVVNPTPFAEFPSMSGKLACGRITRKQAEQLGEALSQEQAETQKQVKLRNIFFLVVSYDGKTATGEDVKVENKLCMYGPGSTGARAFEDAIKGVLKERRALAKTNFKVSLKMETKGTNFYYVPVIEVLAQPVTLTKEDNVALQVAAKFVADTNRYVMDKYNEALSQAAEDTQSEKAMAQVITIENASGATALKNKKKKDVVVDTKEIDDEIPFLIGD